MRYILMCGGVYTKWEKPRHLTVVEGETIIGRTIRLLKDNGITDIAISTNSTCFDDLGVKILRHNNTYEANGYNDWTGYWVDAFYPTNNPACYIFGDVFFSPEAIKTIVNTPTDDIEFFASAPPFAADYPKKSAEPFALKVRDQAMLHDAIKRVKRLYSTGAFKRKPIMWELWQVIKDTPINQIDYTNYTVINDYTCDIDDPEETICR